MINEIKYPKRKQMRLSNYDYSLSGAYFVTIVVKDKAEWFGEIKDGCMKLSNMGKIVGKCWKEIPNHVGGIELDEYIVMPNHIHGIININTVGAAHVRPGHVFNDRSNMLLSKAIHGFKSSASRIIRQRYKNIAFHWQRSYHDRIIRNEKELYEIRQYIHDNPLKWGKDEYKSNNG